MPDRLARDTEGGAAHPRLEPMDSTRVLLVSHHANPKWGSEPLIGWRWATHLDRRVALTLVTHVRNRADIEAAGSLRGEVFYVDTEQLAVAVHRVNDLFWVPSAIVNRSYSRKRDIARVRQSRGPNSPEAGESRRD